MIKKHKNIKESKVSSEYANLWKDALEMALEELESDHYGEMNTSEEMYFMLTDNYGEELGYQGFAAFDRVEGDNLIMHTVYPESVSVLSSVERFLEASEEPDIDVSAIKSEKDKSDALEKIDDYIESLKSDQSSLKDYQWSEEQVEIAEEMNDKGYVEELEIELPDSDWIDFDEYEDEDDAILNAMKDEIVSSLVGYSEDVARKADDVISDARIEVGDLLDSYLDKISDAKEKRKEIEEIEFDDEEFESVRRRRNLRRVIESRRARAKKYNEVMYFDKEGNYLFGKAEMQKRAEELARVLFSKDIDVKDLDVFTVDSGTASYINIKEHTPSKYKFRAEVGIISLKHKDNEITVSGSDHVDRIKLEDDLNTSDTVEIADMIKSSPEFDLIVKEYNNSLSNKKESLRRRNTRK